jgi:hypothetical protein
LPPACWSCQLELIKAGTAGGAVHRRGLDSRFVPPPGVSISVVIDCIAARSEAASTLWRLWLESSSTRRCCGQRVAEHWHCGQFRCTGHATKPVVAEPEWKRSRQKFKCSGK